MRMPYASWWCPTTTPLSPPFPSLLSIPTNTWLTPTCEEQDQALLITFIPPRSTRTVLCCLVETSRARSVHSLVHVLSFLGHHCCCASSTFRPHAMSATYWGGFDVEQVSNNWQTGSAAWLPAHTSWIQMSLSTSIEVKQGILNCTWNMHTVCRKEGHVLTALPPVSLLCPPPNKISITYQPCLTWAGTRVYIFRQKQSFQCLLNLKCVNTLKPFPQIMLERAISCVQ